MKYRGHYIGDLLDIRHIDGKGTLILTAKQTIKLLGVRSVLQEVPDASATTLTVAVTDEDDAAITDTGTFTEGSEVKGAVVDHVMDATYWEIVRGKTIKIVTGGTTTTLGEAIVELKIARQ